MVDTREIETLEQEAIDSSNLPVEISGWDVEGTFFVETTNLDWGEPGARTVRLRRHLRPGSLVFLRLLKSTGLGRGCPIPHTVGIIEGPERGGWSKIELVESQPKHAISKSPEESLEHLIQCVRREVKP